MVQSFIKQAVSFDAQPAPAQLMTFPIRVLCTQEGRLVSEVGDLNERCSLTMSVDVEQKVWPSCESEVKSEL